MMRKNLSEEKTKKKSGKKGHSPRKDFGEREGWEWQKIYSSTKKKKKKKTKIFSCPKMCLKSSLPECMK